MILRITARRPFEVLIDGDSSTAHSADADIRSTYDSSPSKDFRFAISCCSGIVLADAKLPRLSSKYRLLVIVDAVDMESSPTGVSLVERDRLESFEL